MARRCQPGKLLSWVQASSYADAVGTLKTLHVLGAAFLFGGVTSQLLVRLQAARAASAAQQILYELAAQVQRTMVVTGGLLVFITGVLLWFNEKIAFFTGWLLLGVLLYAAVMALDGAFLSPNLRRLRSALQAGTSPAPADAGAATIQVITWVLLIVVIFLMAARPF